MKTASIILVLALLTVLPLGLLAQDSLQTKDGPQAVIKFAQIYHNFGSVGNDTTLTYRFVFRNAGDDTLRIFRLKSG